MKKITAVLLFAAAVSSSYLSSGRASDDAPNSEVATAILSRNGGVVSDAKKRAALPASVKCSDGATIQKMNEANPKVSDAKKGSYNTQVFASADSRTTNP